MILFATSFAKPCAPKYIFLSITNPAPRPVDTVKYCTILQSFPSPTTASASPARFASLSKYTGFPVFSLSTFDISRLCHLPLRFGGVSTFPLIKSSGPGQDIPIPVMSLSKAFTISLILLSVISGSLLSVENCSLLTIFNSSSIKATLVFVPPISIATAYFIYFTHIVTNLQCDNSFTEIVLFSTLISSVFSSFRFV